jgi:hypothetical protein
VVFLAAVAVGYGLASRLSPEPLREEVQARLQEALGSPVSLGELRVSIGLGLELDGRDLRVWPAGPDAALVIDRVEATLRPLSHLTGQLRLRRIRLSGVRLRVTRTREGRWMPEPVAKLLAGDPEPAAPDRGHPVELLSPLIALETAARLLLERAHVADRVELRDVEIALEDAKSPGTLRVEKLIARLRHRALIGDTRLSLRAQLRDPSGALGSFEWDARLTRRGAIRIVAAATDLDLGALAHRAGRLAANAKLDGALSGVFSFHAPEPGRGRLELDLVGKHTTILRAEPSASDPFRADRLELAGVLEIAPDSVHLLGGRFRSDEHALELEGVLERPLRDRSLGRFTLTLRDIGLDEVRHLIAWLPEVQRAEAEAVLASLESGHLIRLRTGGSAALSDWRDFVAGRTRRIPGGFVLDAELIDAVVRVGDSDRIEGLSGRLAWTRDRIEASDVRAKLNGKPLPRLELVLDGVSSFLAVDPERRRLASGAPPLLGLRPLWEALHPHDENGDRRPPPELRLDIERLEHPMFLWPIERLRGGLTPTADGLHIETWGGTWGGVPVSGEADWLFEPEERVRVRLAATPPDAEVPPTDRRPGWARGRVEIGHFEGRRWRHERLAAGFDATAGGVRLHDGEIDLIPWGRAQASALLDLSRADAVPFRLSARIETGDVSSLAALVGLPAELATGRVDAAGSVEGEIVPGTSVFAGLTGLVELDAHDGTIRRAVPAVAAIALASEVFNPFARREIVRYEQVQTFLEFEAGRMHTTGLSLDGPDVRAFASGGIDLASASREVDVDIVLFLFRPVDNVVGRIPILKMLLLGPNENLIAAHYELSGPWEEPKAKLVPLRSIATGPASLVFEQIPAFVRRGLEAVGALLGGSASSEGGRPPG